MPGSDGVDWEENGDRGAASGSARRSMDKSRVVNRSAMIESGPARLG